MPSSFMAPSVWASSLSSRMRPWVCLYAAARPRHTNVFSSCRSSALSLYAAARPRHTNVFSSCRSSALSLTRYLFISIPSAHAPILFDLGLVDYSGSVLNSKMFDC